MRMKIFVVSLGTLLFATCCIAFNLWGGTSAKTESVISRISEPKAQTDPVNEAANPDDIPDRLAYMLLFRFLSNSSLSQDENVRRQAHAYLRQARLGKRSCTTCQTADLTDEADISVLMSAANEFRKRVGALDTQAVQLKRQNRVNRDPAITVQLARLQLEKEIITDSIVASLSARLSSHAKQELRRFIREHVKKNIRLNQEGR